MKNSAAIQNYKGFTLIEMAVVLVIVGLLLGGLLMPLSAQMEQQHYNQTNKILEESKEALFGYAMSHSATDGKPYLPCPDTNNDGVEQARAGGVCPSFEGRLPWVTLGLLRGDGWSNLIRYRVTPAFANDLVGFTLSSVGTSRVCDSSACTNVLASAVPVVLVSHGKNGYGAWNQNNVVNLVPSTISANEFENIDGRNFPTAGNNTADTADNADLDFVSAIPSPTFDDIVVWVSPNVLFNRMVTAGKLP